MCHPLLFFASFRLMICSERCCMYAISCKSNTGGASWPDILMSSRLQFMGGSGWPWHSLDFCCNECVLCQGAGQVAQRIVQTLLSVTPYSVSVKW